MKAARLELHNVKRLYRNGREPIAALDGVNLVIEPGEMVAIIGASGSGKSTLMNVLGCLDRPDSGAYAIDGIHVERLGPNELAHLRRVHFGFVFQRYHLLASLSAARNVELPGMYAGLPKEDRKQKARTLIAGLGLVDRLSARPNELSGGQQQRIAIARALMNDAGIILADEPTGALDSRSGETVMALLKSLNRDGHTVVIVTHDHAVAAHANRIVEIADGAIIADSVPKSHDAQKNAERPSKYRRGASFLSRLSALGSAFGMSLRAMASQKLRTALTMVGIVIGITAVVAVVGLGEGARLQVMAQMSDLGSSTISIYAGRDFSDPNTAKITSLSTDDAELLGLQPYLDSVSPEMVTTLKLRREGRVADAQVSGVGPSFFRTNGLKIMSGRELSAIDVEKALPNVIISDLAASALFGKTNPLGQTVLVDKSPMTVVGVLSPRPSAGRTLMVYLSYTTMRERLVGNFPLSSIVLRVKDGIESTVAERTVSNLMMRRHGVKDFFLVNKDQLRRSAERTMLIFSLLITGLAAIALMVGGIGVMNIMLISVTERTREIGLRMAVGARRSDIMMQFMIEALAVCLVGGVIGSLIAVLTATVANRFGLPFPIILNWHAILLAFGSTVLIGVIFGYLPARNAARLDPVEALARE